MWLHIPREYLASAPAEEDSTSASASLCQELARSATWRETSLKPASWARALKRASWTMRLSGLTCSPSTASRGVASWIASLVVSRVSPTPTPESGLESLTSAICGLPLQDWYRLLRLRSASSRTYQASLITTTETSDPTYKPWATRLRKESSQRRRSARVTFGSGSTSWPTAMAADGTKPSAGNRANADLTHVSMSWQTPTSGGHHSHNSGDMKHQYDLLPKQAATWQTPSVADTTGGHLNRSGDRASELLLRGQAKAWATPRTSDTNGAGKHGEGSPDLRTQIGAWARPTPASRDHKGDDLPSRQGVPSLPALVIAMDGNAGSPTGRVLNPAFVEMLMGWPPGLTDYASSETESCRWWPLMRGVLCRLG